MNIFHIIRSFSLTLEIGGQIQFLVYSVRKHVTKGRLFQKPTMTETTIYYLSNSPTERKVAAYRASMYRMKALSARQNESKENGILYSK
jgi:hypothetical protein